MRKPFQWRGSWYVKVKGADGKRRNVHLDPDEEKALKKWAEMFAAERPESPTAPVFSIVEAFLSWAERNVSAKTYRGYGAFIKSFCDLYAHHIARELKPFHVTRWLEKNPDWAAADSQRAAIAAVKRVFNWAVDEGLIERNPLAGVRKPGANRREGLITDEQHAAMMLDEDKGRKPGGRLAKLGRRAVRRDACFRLVLIALKHSGARPGMVAKVRIEDVAADLSCWVMKEHKNRKKTGAPLVIYLSPCLQTVTRLAMRGRGSGPLFLNSHGKAWTANSIGCRMKGLKKKLGLPAGTVAYAYRHTFLTTALENGVGLAAAAELAGHSDLKMIARHYGHLDKKAEHLKGAAAQAVRRRGAG